MAELQDEVSDPTSQGKVDEEEILEAARRFINSTNRLRSSALDTASRLQDIAEYLTQSVNAGTLLLRDNYDSDKVDKFEDFVEPEDFDIIIATLQWQDVAKAVRLCTFESTYFLLKALVFARASCLQSIVRLRRIGNESRTRPGPTFSDDFEEEDTGPSNRRHNAILPGRELIGSVAYDENVSVRARLQEEIALALKPALRRLEQLVNDATEDINAISEEELGNYRQSDVAGRVLLLQQLYDAAMAEDQWHLHEDTYKRRMRHIRALQLNTEVENMEMWITTLQGIISEFQVAVKTKARA